jgi:Xaa-Pro aminopeptidase
MADMTTRRARLDAVLDERGVDAVFLPPSADLEYLTGLQRRIPTFGEVCYTHHWVAGAFIAPGQDPLFVLPRMIAEFDLPEGIPGEVLLVSEEDDPEPIFAEAAARLGGPRRMGVGARAWAQTVLGLRRAMGDIDMVDATELVNVLRRIKDDEEVASMRRVCGMADEALEAVAPKVTAGVTEMELAEEVNHHLVRNGARTWSFDTAVWAMGPGDERDATVRISLAPLREGTGVSFDFGAVADGWCSDFGRTIHVGEPNEEYQRVHALVMAAQQAGIDAVAPGVTAAEVHEATRAVIVDGGYGEWFRHRTGHCIGMDVHERPFISEEEDTALEEGMTFTIEPSVFWPTRVGVRVEDVILCTADGGVNLNDFHHELMASAS